MNNIIDIKDYLKQKQEDKDLSASQLLINASKRDIAHAFVITWPSDGSMPTYHTSTTDTPVILMRLQEFIHKVYNEEFD